MLPFPVEAAKCFCITLAVEKFLLDFHLNIGCSFFLELLNIGIT